MAAGDTGCSNFGFLVNRPEIVLLVGCALVSQRQQHSVITTQNGRFPLIISGTLNDEDWPVTEKVKIGFPVGSGDCVFGLTLHTTFFFFFPNLFFSRGLKYRHTGSKLKIPFRN